MGKWPQERDQNMLEYLFFIIIIFECFKCKIIIKIKVK